MIQDLKKMLEKYSSLVKTKFLILKLDLCLGHNPFQRLREKTINVIISLPIVPGGGFPVPGRRRAVGSSSSSLLSLLTLLHIQPADLLLNLLLPATQDRPVSPANSPELIATQVNY